MPTARPDHSDHGEHIHHDDHGEHSHHGVHSSHGGHDKHAGHDPAIFRRKFWLSLALSVVIAGTSHMIMDWFGYRLDFPGVELIGPVLGTIVFFYGGWPFLTGGLAEIRNRQPGMMLLISMAIVVAYVASLLTSFGVFDLDFWWELAALVTIMLLGHWQEMKAIGQAQGALNALASLLPDEAERVGADGGIERLPVDQLSVGDVVLVRSGGRVPADGRIVSGEAELDESMITGESAPVSRGEGDRVVAGTVATDSAIRVRIDAVGEDTALAGIARLVAEAQSSHGRAQALADRFAALLFYIASAAGLVTFLVWWAIGSLDEAVERSVTVLVIACPHALGLAIPLVIALSTAMAARNGILVKNRIALERMRTIDAVLFDKTGTLTAGRHAVTGVAATDPTTEQDVRLIAAAVESESEHPLARAIVASVEGQGADVPRAEGFRSLTGKGVRAIVDGSAYAVGGPALLREYAVQVPAQLAGRTREWAERGASILHLLRLDNPDRDPGRTADGHPDRTADGNDGNDGGDEPRPRATVLAAFALEDEVRPEAAEALAEARSLGVRTIAMVTGDARGVADAIASDLERTNHAARLDEVYAELLPAEKDRAVTDLRDKGHTVAMVGDGVNDAPALARADVGLAIGAGTDVAIESAGLVLASSDPRGVAAVIRLSRATYRKMIQNLVWAAGYNIAAIPLAAGVLAWAGISLSPAIGAVLMSLSTIVVALNAQLLRRVELRPAARAYASDNPSRTDVTAPRA